MKSGTIAISMAVLGSYGGIFWNYSSMLKNVESMQERIAGLDSDIQPIHTRCEKLGARLGTVKEELEAVWDSSSAISGRIADHEALLQSNDGQLDRFGQNLAEVEEGVRGWEQELRAALDDQVLAGQELESRLSEQGAQMERLQSQSEAVPEGTILSWLPSGGAVPPGWLICDGSLGTPDLRGFFLRGVGRFEQAGLYAKSARMSPAGVHSHATDLGRSNHNLTRTGPHKAGEWLILFDAGIESDDSTALAIHGSHVHEDEHVPANYSVIYIIKAPR